MEDTKLTNFTPYILVLRMYVSLIRYNHFKSYPLEFKEGKTNKLYFNSKK